MALLHSPVRILIIGLALVFHGLTFAGTPAQPSPSSKPTRVACVGDSITAGYGESRGLSYPAQLGELLGSDWEVRNFGVSGRTLLRQGDFPYWKETAFAKAKEYQPDVVIILLGANDTKPHNWKYRDQFARDYSDLIAEFQALPSKPRILLGLPIPVVGAGNFGITEPLAEELRVLIRQIATDKKLETIDYHAALSGHPDYIPDRVHPNADGYEVMAATACLALTGRAPTPRTLPHRYFRSHAVLPRDVPVPVFGTGPEGTQVTVSFADQTLSTKVVNGRWEVVLAPLKASAAPATLTVVGSTTTVAEDVVVGDVWLASGQSNMERQLGKRGGQPDIVGWKEAAARADYPLIRQYYVPQVTGGPDHRSHDGTWTVCSPQTASDFTAVGFFFARAIQPVAGVPIGIIHASKGGSRIESWLSQEAWSSAPEPEKRAGQTFRPSNHYYAMIAPLARIPLRGVLWYQGESNAEFADQYPGLFSALISSWRDLWKNPDLPFLFVQIAPHEKMVPEIREAQLRVHKTTPHTAMVVTTDVGDAKDIHPPRKQEVGERLALAAQALAYGGKEAYSGPLFRSAKVEGKTMIVTFDHADQGLVAQDGGELKGFTLAGPDGVFLPATARIVGATVVVSQETITQPAAVRYGWANVPDVNLANTAGLPASPFRSDTP